jgi:hypothetical protein
MPRSASKPSMVFFSLTRDLSSSSMQNYTLTVGFKKFKCHY